MSHLKTSDVFDHVCRLCGETFLSLHRRIDEPDRLCGTCLKRTLERLQARERHPAGKDFDLVDHAYRDSLDNSDPELEQIDLERAFIKATGLPLPEEDVLRRELVNEWRRALRDS